VDTPKAQQGFMIDPDIVFDDDGKVVIAGSGTPIVACYQNIETGKMREP
jgi:beta-xylosidase